MSWITDNWDKIISVFIATIVAGLIGWFSAIISLKNDINELRTQIQTNYMELKKEFEKVSPKLGSLDSLTNKTDNLEKRMVMLQTRTEDISGDTKDIKKMFIYKVQYQHSK